MKNDKQFNELLVDRINLNPSRIATLNSRVAAVGDYLKANLDGYQRRENQGSYATKTIIKPRDGKEFDADIMIHVKRDPNRDAKSYLNQIYNVLKKHSAYNTIVSRKTRCVTLNYAGDFHLDIAPCVERNSAKYICNGRENKFEITDGAKYKEWLNKKNELSGGYLKKVIKLCKYQRDVKNNFSCKSILLTTLLGDQIKSRKNYSGLSEAFYDIVNSLNDYLKSRQRMPIIKNPVLPNEDFTRHWDQKKYSNFKQKIALYTSKINYAYKESDPAKSEKGWQAVLGDDFGGSQNRSRTASEDLLRPKLPVGKLGGNVGGPLHYKRVVGKKVVGKRAVGNKTRKNSATNQTPPINANPPFPKPISAAYGENPLFASRPKAKSKSRSRKGYGYKRGGGPGIARFLAHVRRMERRLGGR